jgi:hypothetical protein
LNKKVKEILNYHDKSHFVLDKEVYQQIDEDTYEALQNGKITLGKSS